MQAISVGTISTPVCPAGNRDFVALFNNDASATVYLSFDGDAAALTTANGFPLPAQQSLFLNNVSVHNSINKAINAICASGTVDLRAQGI